MLNDARRWRAQQASEPVTDVQAVWLLAGSAGATGAVLRFLGAFRRRPPVAFLYAQHYDPARQEQLRQLASPSSLFALRLIEERHPLRAGEVLIVPPRWRIGIDAEAVWAEREAGWEAAGHTPDIDELEVLLAAARLPARGLILFSGMGNDGAGGLDVLDTTGCRLWVQQPASAVCRGMPEAALASGLVHRSATPELLAAALEQLYE
ncbi:chemotaxis protein CheB [Parahaliea mediterranea]|uniref:chemotaxis protein CheB n=1 Tax=Parahaliea mediterranea TaxID=651086 RepID=UPI000E2E5FCD|nr:chemotaxis protein CheB [Parahaliea mediterranea]